MWIICFGEGGKAWLDKTWKYLSLLPTSSPSYWFDMLWGYFVDRKRLCQYWFMMPVSVSNCGCNNHQKVSCLKQHLVRILQSCRSEVQYGSQGAKIMLLAGLHYFMDIPRENPFSFLFQLLEAARISSWPCSSIFKAYLLHSITDHFSMVKSPSDHSWERFSDFNHLCD